MTRRTDLTRLASLAGLMLDHRLGQLRSRADALEHSRMQLTAINQTNHPADLDPVTSARVGLDYERWADARRAELNLVIARQTAAWHEARAEAQTAFGRLQALRGLSARQEKGR
jgi:post-segregation antitoxin (ccd killing protein)